MFGPDAAASAALAIQPNLAAHTSSLGPASTEPVHCTSQFHDADKDVKLNYRKRARELDSRQSLHIMKPAVTATKRRGSVQIVGTIVQLLGTTPMIYADCGAGSYHWLPLHEVAGSEEDNRTIATARLHELGCLICCNRKIAQLVLVGCALFQVVTHLEAAHIYVGSVLKFHSVWAQIYADLKSAA